MLFHSPPRNPFTYRVGTPPTRSKTAAAEAKYSQCPASSANRKSSSGSAMRSSRFKVVVYVWVRWSHATTASTLAAPLVLPAVSSRARVRTFAPSELGRRR